MDFTSPRWLPIVLLTLSNVFMTFAWYGHLKHKSAPLWVVILASWGIALFEYIFQVPANRLGSNEWTVPQLKVLQECITLVVFTGVAFVLFKSPIKWNIMAAYALIVGAVYLTFKYWSISRAWDLFTQVTIHEKLMGPAVLSRPVRIEFTESAENETAFSPKDDTSPGLLIISSSAIDAHWLAEDSQPPSTFNSHRTSEFSISSNHRCPPPPPIPKLTPPPLDPVVPLVPLVPFVPLVPLETLPPTTFPVEPLWPVPELFTPLLSCTPLLLGVTTFPIRGAVLSIVVWNCPLRTSVVSRGRDPIVSRRNDVPAPVPGPAAIGAGALDLVSSADGGVFNVIVVPTGAFTAFVTTW
jgi:uncharacterized protein (DUF486 family)